ncbi:uncharacterized protein FIBRA_02582 [Fibroporia radiculosa]|uniref:NAD(P)-binding protein n=1 Tax=Fibroporia radiculosa TaxID=599839 RepID=J4G1X4_9APHY|nr:uncharacterized protein FIBRA_02582 [Fibroporia radiculosa]CCM00548.1 predicted protein [Fibroporia radiculosa]
MPSYAVVGASRGIGLEIAMNPVNVVFALVRDKSNSPHISTLASSHVNVFVVEADAIDHRALTAAAAEAAKVTGGSLDVLIYNAAHMDITYLFHSLTDYDNGDQLDTEITKAFKVNVLGAVHSVNAFLPLLREGATKKVLIMSSEAGDRELTRQIQFSTMGAYGLTKAALDMVMAKYAVQLKKEGFTIFSVSPGPTDTTDTATQTTIAASRPELEELIRQWKEVDPNLDPTLKPVDEIVRKMLKLLASLGPADSGTFRPSEEIRAIQI